MKTLDDSLNELELKKQKEIDRTLEKAKKEKEKFDYYYEMTKKYHELQLANCARYHYGLINIFDFYFNLKKNIINYEKEKKKYKKMFKN